MRRRLNVDVSSYECMLFVYLSSVMLRHDSQHHKKRDRAVSIRDSSGGRARVL
jgi:hypothetical protein